MIPANEVLMLRQDAKCGCRASYGTAGDQNSRLVRDVFDKLMETEEPVEELEIRARGLSESQMDELITRLRRLDSPIVASDGGGGGGGRCGDSCPQCFLPCERAKGHEEDDWIHMCGNQHTWLW